MEKENFGLNRLWLDLANTLILFDIAGSIVKVKNRLFFDLVWRRRKNMDRTKNISLIVLVLLAIGAFGYIGYDKYSDMTEQKQAVLLDQAAQFGYTQAIAQIAQNAATCQQVPLIIENQTINLIAVECL